jgi:hypothetical protein
VGLWDAGIRCPFLASLAEQLNRAQPSIVFAEVVAPPPAGAQRSSRRFDSVSPRAERIAETLGLDVVAALCPSGPEPGRGGRQAGRSSVILSAQGLRGMQAPVEGLLAWAALGDILGALARASLRHAPSGCLFDAYADPGEIAKGLASGHVDAACLGRLPRKLREPTLAIIATLVDYTRGTISDTVGG